jgi:hypothetical protein
MTDRTGIEQAMKLLAKATSTDSDPEAIALVEHVYRLLAKLITEDDLSRGETTFGLSRRERRLISDRRAVTGSQPVTNRGSGELYFEMITTRSLASCGLDLYL